MVLIASLLSAVGIALLAPRMAPIGAGNAHSFWRIAAGVKLSPDSDYGWGGNAYVVDADWAAYELAHLHGSEVYRVSMADVSAEFDAVVAELEQAAQRREDTPFVTGYLKWRNDSDQPRSEPALLASIKRELNRRRFEKDVDLLAYAVAEEQQFWQRWRRADWYWARIVFEWTFLTSLALFLLLPIIRSRPLWRWAIHVGLSPFLFLLPAYLGYATTSFTSAGPSGGVLYPSC